MTYEGVLTKMQTEFLTPIQYYLVFENSFLNLNQVLDKNIEIHFEGYQCLNCNKKKKIFRQGFCYDCFMSSPSAGDWIMKPELSTAHLGIQDRDLAYEENLQIMTWAKAEGKRKEIKEVFKSLKDRVELAVKEIKKDFKL